MLSSVDKSVNKVKITLNTFESITADLMDRMMAIVRRLLDKAKLKPADIAVVLLVGGATRMPAVERRLREIFGGDKIKKRVNADEAVAYGAAVHAAQLSEKLKVSCGRRLSADNRVDHNKFQGQLPPMRLLRATPLALGTDNEGIFQRLIPQNSRVPSDSTYVWSFETIVNDQDHIEFKVMCDCECCLQGPSPTNPIHRSSRE